MEKRCLDFGWTDKSMHLRRGDCSVSCWQPAWVWISLQCVQ